MVEPYVQIGDHVLTEAQAMAVRVAVTDFHMMVSGDDETREGLGPIADAYRDRLGEVLKIWLSKIGAVMPTFEALMKVVHNETWTVEAKDKNEAQKKFEELAADVIDDDSGGEVVDWEPISIKQMSK